MTAITRQIDLTTPRTVGQILNTALRLYAQMPLLFITLAGIVVIPYELLVVLLSSGKASAATQLLLALAGLAIVNPFISALEMQALLDLGEGRRPEISSVIRRGLGVLPVVAATQIVAGLAELAGLLLVLPAIYLAVRLAVAAPVAATESTDWPGAIRRSVSLTRGNFFRVLAVLAVQVPLYLAVSLIVGHLAAATIIVGLLLAVVSQSFSTLLISLLYFDLRARATTPVA